MTIHKSEILYPNSTIVEAVCEFHFAANAETMIGSWNDQWFNEFHSQIGADYKIEKRVFNKTFRKTENNALNEYPIERWIYKHINNSQLIQLSPWVLTINEIDQPYPGWPIFFNHIEFGLNSLKTIINPFFIERIVLRYINRIPKNHPKETVGVWLNNPSALPQSLLEQSSHFFYRCEVPHSETVMKMITVTEERNNSLNKPIIFDIQAYVNMGRVNFQNDIREAISNLHAVVRNEFDHSLTEQLAGYLESER